MASCTTSQWSNQWTPQAKLTVTISSQTDTTAKLSWTLDIVFHGNSMTSTAKKSWTVNVGGSKWSGTTTIGGISGTKRISSGTKTITKTTSTQKISFSVSFSFNITWGGKYGGTKSASGSINVGAKTSYTITYNANGGSGAPGKQTKWHGTTLKLSTTKPTRTGYSFQGWGTSASGSVVYDSGDSYTKNASDTLYAIWKANTYTITFDANTGENPPENQTKTYGVDLVLTSEIPTKTNYNFLGWGISASSTTVAYAPGATYTDNSAATLYAIWELAYIAPRINNVTIGRANATGELSDEGNYARVVFDWATDKDVVSIQIGYRLQEEETYTYVDLTASGISGSVDYVLNGNFDTEKYYDIQILITDSLGNNNVVRVLEAMKFIIDIKRGGTGIAFNKPASLDGFDVNFESYFRQPINLIDAGGEGIDWELVPKLQELSDGVEKNADDISNLNNNLTQLPKIEVPVTINTQYVSDYISICYYYPSINACYLRVRFTRKANLDGGTAGESIVLGYIPGEYVNYFLSPLTTYTAQGSLNAEVQGYVSTDGNVTIRMNGSTNPTYYYLAGFWVVD